MGGYDLAKRVILDAVQRGKHVVTANKALLAVHGEEIFAAASRHGIDLGFEASVGGGIPVIRALTEGLAANNIQSIYGIINGTSNYILSRMTSEGQRFEVVLEDAKQAGYAEADPTFDVAGIDSAHKLAIMVSLAYGTPVNFKEIYTEGIAGLTPMISPMRRNSDLRSSCWRSRNIPTARLRPACIPPWFRPPLKSPRWTACIMRFNWSATPWRMSCSMAAGPDRCQRAARWSAMSSSIARNLLKSATGRVPPRHFSKINGVRYGCGRWKKSRRSTIFVSWSWTARVCCRRLPGVLGRYGISISSVLQQGRKEGQTVPVVIMTHMAKERDVQNALRDINPMPYISEPTTLIRVEGRDE